jgi:hypothetical protein
VATLHTTADAGDWGSVGLHCVASGVLGPLWEEVRSGVLKDNFVNH